MSNPDPLDKDSPVRAIRPITLEKYRYTFRRVASALVRTGRVGIDAVTGLKILVEVDNFKEGLRPFLQADGKSSGFVHMMATQLVAVARRHLRLSDDHLDELKVIATRLRPANVAGMGQRNRVRLEQFDDEAVVQRLLRFPEDELGRALSQRNPFRRAKGVERALAISILIFTGIRVKNLRQFRLDQNIRRSGKRVFIRYVEDETKTHAALELELPAETIGLLDAFLDQHRGQLPCADSPWLFPGQSDGPRSYSAMRDAVGRPLRKHAGIELSPHLYRHIIAKIVAERAPENLHHVSRMLGHKSIRPTYRCYLGTEAPAASRWFADLVRKVRDTEE
jgi:integrase